MHLMSREHRAAASGIVGAPGPLACGFAFAARGHRRGDIAVALFGDGAVNEGMLMESLNLAAVWRLPVVFVCKDNGWAVTSRPGALTGGGLRRRAEGLGLPVRRVDGRNAVAVSRVAGAAVRRARAGHGPTFVIARCRRPEGHFMGDPLTRLTRATSELRHEVQPLLGTVAAQPGAPVPSRVRALLSVTGTLAHAALHGRSRRADPLLRLRRRIPGAMAAEAEERARSEADAAVAATLAEVREPSRD
jgi:pyruvate dehydrogenase E1 component alpha subunit